MNQTAEKEVVQAGCPSEKKEMGLGHKSGPGRSCRAIRKRTEEAGHLGGHTVALAYQFLCPVCRFSYLWSTTVQRYQKGNFINKEFIHFKQ